MTFRKEERTFTPFILAKSSAAGASGTELRDMLAAALVSGVLVTAYVLPPVALTNVQCRSMPARAAVVRAESLYASDGGEPEVDWDKVRDTPTPRTWP